MDPKKIVNISLIVVAGILYLVLSRFFGWIFDTAGIAVHRDFYLTYPEMIGVLVCGGILFVAYTNKKLKLFLVESVGELMKVTYPTRKETIQSALVVVVMVALATVILAVFDSVWSFITQKFLN